MAGVTLRSTTSAAVLPANGASALCALSVSSTSTRSLSCVTVPSAGASSAPSTRGRCGDSVTRSWHSVWVRSRASSSPRWVGFAPTTTAPTSAAASSQKTNSATLSSSTATWKGPSTRCARSQAARWAAWATTSAWVSRSSPATRPRWWSSARSRTARAIVSAEGRLVARIAGLVRRHLSWGHCISKLL